VKQTPGVIPGSKQHPGGRKNLQLYKLYKLMKNILENFRFLTKKITVLFKYNKK